MGATGNFKKKNLTTDEQSINSYSIKSMKGKDRKKRQKSGKYKRTRSHSSQNEIDL